MVAPVDEVLFGLAEEAIRIWGIQGEVTPASFVIGHSRSIFAQAYNDEGLALPQDARTAMDALLINACSAVYLGRIDESWLKIRSIADPPMTMEQLSFDAMNDPSVVTAIVVQAINTKTRDSSVLIAKQTIDDDDDEIAWEFDYFTNPEGDSVIMAVEACGMAAGITNPISDAELKEELLQIGWAMMDSDDLARAKMEGES